MIILRSALKGLNYIAEGNALRKNDNLNLRPERALLYTVPPFQGLWLGCLFRKALPYAI